MAVLTDLSAELVLCFASFLRQVDLLNLSLTSRYIRQITESELFREYQWRRGGRNLSLGNYILHILQNPRLARYVKTLEFGGWDNLASLNPEFYVSPQNEQDRERKQVEFDAFRTLEPTKADYMSCTQAAKSSAIINEIYPYEDESIIIKKVRPMLPSDEVATHPNVFHRFLLDDEIPTEKLPFDRKFCQLLRAGIDEAYIMLLFAILPNVTSIFMRGPCPDITSLRWPLPKHGFRALRQLKAGQCDVLIPWGIGWLNAVLNSASQMETLLVHRASSWSPNGTGQIPVDLKAMPLVLQPGSLSVTRIELVSCTERCSDMKTLIDACPHLLSLHYSVGDEEAGEFSVDPKELVDLLDAHKDTLRELYLEIFPFWTESDDEFDHLTSLSHFTALKVLDTSADMWQELADGYLENRLASQELSLSNRLPRSLETLVFHVPTPQYGPGWSDSPASSQIVDLLRNRQHCTPVLQKLLVGFLNQEQARDFNEDLWHMRKQMNGLNFKIIIGKRAQVLSPNSGSHSYPDHDLPVTKWFGNKYATRRMKKSPYNTELIRLCNLPDNRNLDFEDMVAVIKTDERMQELLTEMKLTGPTDLEYESEDIQEGSVEDIEAGSEIDFEDLPRRYSWRDVWRESEEEEDDEEE